MQEARILKFTSTWRTLKIARDTHNQLCFTLERHSLFKIGSNSAPGIARGAQFSFVSLSSASHFKIGSPAAPSIARGAQNPATCYNFFVYLSSP
jgi:hypothetical protein